jgi:hypothetical protein
LTPSDDVLGRSGDALERACERSELVRVRAGASCASGASSGASAASCASEASSGGSVAEAQPQALAISLATLSSPTHFASAVSCATVAESVSLGAPASYPLGQVTECASRNARHGRTQESRPTACGVPHRSAWWRLLGRSSASQPPHLTGMHRRVRPGAVLPCSVLAGPSRLSGSALSV